MKNAAAAGAGTYSFIYDSKQIDEKVILALQKNYAPIKNLQSIELFDKNDKHLDY